MSPAVSASRRAIDLDLDLDLELHERRAGGDGLAGPRAVAAHPAGDGGGDVHHRLRRFERDHRLVEGDAFALGDVPLHDVRLGETFAEVGEPKSRDGHGAYRKPRPGSRGRFPASREDDAARPGDLPSGRRRRSITRRRDAAAGWPSPTRRSRPRETDRPAGRQTRRSRWPPPPRRCRSQGRGRGRSRWGCGRPARGG